MSNSILMGGGGGGGPGNLAPSAPAGLAQEVIYSQVPAFLVVHSAHSRRLTCVNISGYLVGWVIENDCSARRTSQRFQGGCRVPTKHFIPNLQRCGRLAQYIFRRRF